MSDLFEDKARDWDQRPGPQIISEGVGAHLRKAVDWAPTMRVMDFGAGTGLVAGHVAPLVAHIAAVDVSPGMLEQLAAKTALRGKVSIHCQDILRQPLGERFDGIVSAMAMHHVEDTVGLLAAFRDHLVPGGFIAVADLDTEDGSFHPPEIEGVFHHGFDRRRLGALLGDAGFNDPRFVTAVEIRKESGHVYPVFLVTATRA